MRNQNDVKLRRTPRYRFVTFLANITLKYSHEATYLQSLDEKGRIRYQIQTVCEAYKEYRVLDKERLFVVGYQIEQNRLVEDELLTSELNALIVLATKYDMDPTYLKSDEFIVSIYWTMKIKSFTRFVNRCRVVLMAFNFITGYRHHRMRPPGARCTESSDSSTQEIDVSLSKTLDFESQIKNNWEDWKTLLGWFACVAGPKARED